MYKYCDLGFVISYIIGFLGNCSSSNSIIKEELGVWYQKEIEDKWKSQFKRIHPRHTLYIYIFTPPYMVPWYHIVLENVIMILIYSNVTSIYLLTVLVFITTLIKF